MTATRLERMAKRAKLPRIFKKIANGKSLAEACKPESFPAPQTVREWIRADESGVLAAEYAHAREAAADYYGHKVGAVAESVLEGEHDARTASVAIDGFKWSAARMHPNRWGDRQIIEQTTKHIVSLGSNLSVGDSESHDRLLGNPEVLGLEPAEVMPLPLESRNDDGSGVDGGGGEAEPAPKKTPPGGDE